MRCGCGSICTCIVSGGVGVNVTGSGATENPFVITPELSPLPNNLEIITSGLVVQNGTLGYAQNITNQTPIISIVDLTGLSVAVMVGTGRRIRVTGHVLAGSTAINDTISLLVRESSTELQITEFRNGAANASEGLPITVILTPSAGSHTYKLSMRRSSGTGTLTMSAGASYPAFILVEDIGT